MSPNLTRASQIAALLASTLVMLSPAIAEICDKAVGENWRSKDGPVWLLNPVGLPIGLTIMIGGAVVAAKVRWFGYFGSAVLVLCAVALVLADLVPQHDIYLAQIREGCRSFRTDLADVGLITISAFAYGWLGYRVGRKAAST